MRLLTPGGHRARPRDIFRRSEVGPDATDARAGSRDGAFLYKTIRLPAYRSFSP